MQSRRIRFQIMLVAIIGGLAFFSYLAVSFFVFQSSQKHIEQVRTRYYPTINSVRSLKNHAVHMKELLSNAIGLEDYFLIEDAVELQKEFDGLVLRLESLDAVPSERLQEFRKNYKAYFDRAKQLAVLLLENPELIVEYESQLSEANNNFLQVINWLDQVEQEKTQLFEESFSSASSELSTSIRLGAALGLLSIFILIAFAYGVSRKVVAAIELGEKMKDEFLATVSHELRTPMNGITGSFELLRESGISEKQIDFVQAGLTSSNDMMRLVDDMLAFLDVQNGSVKLNEERFVLKDFLSSVLHRFSILCREKGLTFETVSDGSNMNILKADRNRLAIVISKLLHNAVKFTDEGGVKFSAELVAEKNKTFVLVIVIEDTGPGIPEEMLERLYQPFTQLDGSFTRAFGGLGIGLSMSKQMVKLLGGKLKYELVPTGGSRFKVVVPVEVIGEVTDQSAHGEAKSKGLESSVANRKVRALVVEDNKVNQMVLKGLLSKIGCVVDVANHGEEALALVERGEYDIVFMDCQMPVMDGFKATEIIRKLDSPSAKVPIVAVTANALEGDRERCINAGMNDYLKKPINKEMIEEKLKEYMH